MFRFRKSVALPRERQGYIYYKSLCFRHLKERERDRLTRLCSQAGGEYADALFEFVTADVSATAICMRHHLSRSTLERCVRKYYLMFPKWM